MENLALRERFIDAKNKLYGLTGNSLYIAGRAHDPEFSQIKKTSPLKSALADMLNPLTYYVHSHVIDDMTEKALTGDHAPKPDLRETLTGLTKIAAQQIPRLTPYANQMLKNQVAFKNPAFLASGAVFLFGTALMANPNIRNNVVQNIGQMTQSISKTGEKVSHTLGKKVLTGINPDIPITLKTIPVYKPSKFNV